MSRYARIVKLQPRRGYGSWPRNPQFAAPIDPMDAVYLARARSILHGFVDADDITVQQARDIVRWQDSQRAAAPPPWWRRVLGRKRTQ